MPNMDKTGPQGQGPMTGRGLGRCGIGFERRMGYYFRGRYGRGLGRCYGWNEPETAEEKRKDLEDYQKALQEELEDVEKELNSIGK
ncbi:MAG: DUF5320 domain-containing protein [Microgenomates group bacterium]|nr:DUF5320 domain-containing protein [Microgenomates group bacterium]